MKFLEPCLWGALGGLMFEITRIYGDFQKYISASRRGKGSDHVEVRFSHYFDIPVNILVAIIRVLMGAITGATLSLTYADDTSALLVVAAGFAAPLVLTEIGRVWSFQADLTDSFEPLTVTTESIQEKSDTIDDLRHSSLNHEIDELRREISNNASNSATEIYESRLIEAEAEISRLSERARQETQRGISSDPEQELLVKIYNHGLSAAVASFRMGVIVEIIGAAIIFLGIFMALFKDADQGRSFASVVTMLSGVVVNLLGSVFLVQANQARRHLSSSATMLREDLQLNWRLGKSLSVISKIQSSDRRDAVHEVLAIRILDAPATSDSADANQQRAADGGQ
ncbi:hypothetical protein OOK29_43010 [Streptomyces phaeochromogenes]|uniref:TRADD-N-associated membrane domain-containing protein n=1 Tax=Streptomyces phaeochromogenes TaxID=1923 RepID=UPI002252751F|nr:hypothetical protein [Streptomyces phaeochromogenes]MCX5604915.1 hypothetical protein [Streptomyces phaeochromogenes]